MHDPRAWSGWSLHFDAGAKPGSLGDRHARVLALDDVKAPGVVEVVLGAGAWIEATFSPST